MVTATSGAVDREMTATQTIKVTVTDVDEPPGAPVALAVSGETASGFTVSWTAPENTDRPLRLRRAVSCGHLRGVDGCRARGHGPQPDADGLDAETAYRVQVRAVNAEGMGVWSEAAGEDDAGAGGAVAGQGDRADGGAGGPPGATRVGCAGRRFGEEVAVSG